MSVEMMSIIIAAAGLLISLGGGFFAGLAWLVRRMDERFDKMDARFDKVYGQFDRVDEQFDKVNERIGGVQSELNDVKVAVARIEGPRERLILPSSGRRYFS